MLLSKIIICYITNFTAVSAVTYGSVFNFDTFYLFLYLLNFLVGHRVLLHFLTDTILSENKLRHISPLGKLF